MNFVLSFVALQVHPHLPPVPAAQHKDPHRGKLLVSARWIRFMECAFTRVSFHRKFGYFCTLPKIRVQQSTPHQKTVFHGLKTCNYIFMVRKKYDDCMKNVNHNKESVHLIPRKKIRKLCWLLPYGRLATSRRKAWLVLSTTMYSTQNERRSRKNIFKV